MNGEEEIERLRRLNPVVRSAPPAPGSTRFNAILERSMSQTSTLNRLADPAPPRRRTRWTVVAGIATASVAAAVVAAVSLAGGPGQRSAPGTGPVDAGSVLLAAAERTEQVSSLRFSQPPQGGAAFSAEGEVRGANSRIVSKGEGVTETTVVIGSDRYVTSADGTTRKETIPDDQKLAPFARAAGDLTRAASQDRNVAVVGTEDVRGVKTTHYRLTLPARTSAADPASPVTELPATELAWFELEGVDSYSAPVQVDIWVADNLVRRISGTVQNQDPLTTVEFYDFNAPISITAPAGR
ncbi:hypothetical protein GCM10010435_40700 [Winogradskya consettensis]|uniref:LppX_LprAFG lipoprotein n=1 Tax=Winogradskya consettensis TaxID=113560 RepID=A0A919SDB4_9ACTN|nr:hypothetical protein Aco04nite_16830 [Actinoplanes consettensis]